MFDGSVAVGGSSSTLFVDGSLRVGNTGSPTESIDTGGTARLRGITSGNGTTVVADSNGKLWKQSSSLRYKRNVNDMSDAGASVLSLRPVSFEWNAGGETEIGLIAEEVAEVLPDLVICDGDGHPDAVKYDKLSLHLLGVIRTQRSELAKQRGEIDALRADSRRMEERLIALERRDAQRNER